MNKIISVDGQKFELVVFWAVVGHKKDKPLYEIAYALRPITEKVLVGTLNDEATGETKDFYADVDKPEASKAKTKMFYIDIVGGWFDNTQLRYELTKPQAEAVKAAVEALMEYVTQDSDRTMWKLNHKYMNLMADKARQLLGGNNG